MDLSNAKQINSFSSPIYIFDIPYDNNFKYDLIKECMRWKSETKSFDKMYYEIDTRGWQSQKILFKTANTALNKVSNIITSGVITTVKSIAPDMDLSKYNLQGEGWININETGTLHMPHIHGRSTFSGVYYVKIPISNPEKRKETTNSLGESQKNRSGFIEFLDPRNSVKGFANGIDELGKSFPFTEKITMEPLEGRLMIFPSWLKHWVYPVIESEERISISFNLWFEKKTPRNN